ncbi:MAG: hypothetical protein U0Y10_25450 [Spirosomataceae bacterium]
MAKKTINPKDKELPKVHKDLEGLDLTINSFGEISMSLSIEKINEFLNKNVDDKKLRHRDDLDELKGLKDNE